jgi:multidrug efflux system membrane fusion protein
MRPAMRLTSILAAVGLLTACTNAAEPKTEPVRPVRVLKVGESNGARAVEFAAEVRPRHEIRQSFRVGGKIVERLVEVGSTVRAGQPIARLDATDLALAAASARAQVASVETERNLAAADLKRYTELREKNFISQAEYERRRSTLEAADARLAASQAVFRQASNQAAYAVLTTESDGVITAIEAEAGQVVAAGQTVARLARRGEKEVAFAVPEAQRPFIESAAAFEVSLNALPGKTWKARLRELSPAADPATRTYAVRATLTDTGREVELGMSARVTVVAGAAAPRIEVPVAALFSRGEQPQVFLVDLDAASGAEGTVRPQVVKTAGIVEERVTIASGLKTGDVVVAAGAALLRPGQRVRVLESR